MKQINLPQLLIFLLLSCSATSPIAAQQNCQAPPLPVVAVGQNIFSELQENDLRDAVAEQLQRDYRVIDDEEVTNYLRRIGERIIQNLPPSKLHFQFALVRTATACSYSLQIRLSICSTYLRLPHPNWPRRILNQGSPTECQSAPFTR